MRDDERFEIQRAFEEEFREKVVEYFEMLDPVFESFFGDEKLDEINKYIKLRRKEEIAKITNGLNMEVEKRYDRYVDYG